MTKKFFGFLAVAVLALGFASCGGNQPENKDFKITIDSITATSAYIKVEPTDTAGLYYWGVGEAKEIINVPDDSIIALVNDELDYYLALYKKMGYNFKVTDLLEKGVSDYSFDGFTPETDYVVFALKFNELGQAYGEIAKKTFSTPKWEAQATETLVMAGEYYDSLDEGYYELEAESADGKYYIYLSPDVNSLDEDLTIASFMEPEYLIFVVGNKEVSVVSLDLKASLNSKILTLNGKIVAGNGVEYNTSITAVEGEIIEEAAPARKAPNRKNDKAFKLSRLSSKMK